MLSLMFYLINKIKIMTYLTESERERLIAEALEKARAKWGPREKTEKELQTERDMQAAQALFEVWKKQFKEDFPRYLVTESVNATSMNAGLWLKYRRNGFKVVIHFTALPTPKYYYGIVREHGPKDENIKVFARKMVRRGKVDGWWYARKDTTAEQAYSDFKKLTAALLEAIEQSKQVPLPLRLRRKQEEE
jgi:hypothetical protein